MEKSSRNVIRYWRSCVSDSTLGKGRFTDRDLAKLHKLSKEDLARGDIGPERAKQFFANLPISAAVVSIRIWPRLTTRKSSHGNTVYDGSPKYVAPIVTEGQLYRDGRILPTGRSVIARDLLEPLPEGAFSIGSINDLDKFLTEFPLRSGPVEGTVDSAWQAYRRHSKQMLDDVISDWPQSGDEYMRTGTGLMEIAGEGSAAVRQILKLYDMLIKDKPETPLLSTYSTAEVTAPSDVLVPNKLAQRLGHSNDNFPLAQHQRDVLNHLYAAKNGEVLAVNGPPGTGKTTLLLSIIAGEWVRAALKDGDPPIIVAASTNNQAVTNIIDAFGKDFAQGKGPFKGRWLPDIASFGLFLPARSREAEASRSYQTESFFHKVETESYVQKATQAYMTAAQKALPELKDPDIAHVVSTLRDLIQTEVGKLTSADAAWDHLKQIGTSVAKELGEHPIKTLAQRKIDLDDRLTESKGYQQLQSDWDRYLAEESILFSLFSFLPPIAKKRNLKARVFLTATGYAGRFARHLKIEAISTQIHQSQLDANSRYQNATIQHDLAVNLLGSLQKAQDSWAVAAKALGVENADLSISDQTADTNTRFHLFLLATHYWEGRWLLEMQEALPTIVADRNKTGKKAVVPRWYRRMMLTPCAVSTFASLPDKMSYARFEGGAFHNSYLLNFIDLLIVDEAGQVLPEVAGASFALAKKALVIGDTQQIEPISSLPKSVDIGNLQESGLLAENAGQKGLHRISDLGIMSTNGSAMHVAQTACAYHPHSNLERGLYLFEHRRCYDEIISYCNKICYKGALIPRRGSGGTDGPLVPLGYLHIDGASTSFGGSRSNPTEAKTIAAWLAANRSKLEQHYGQALEKLVGVVTPFGKQVHEIRQACAGKGIRIDTGGMTIGTVHSLQGAERPIVIFSSVYSKHADGQFIDRSTSMLNVAVSRAKDSFLVFGDMDVFSTAPAGSPRAVLAAFLHADPDNALEFDALPREDLGTDTGLLSTLQDAQEHDEFLLKTLAGNARKICVVSPWIILSTMERSGVFAAFKDARNRGAEIEIYVDPLLNLGDKPTLEPARIALKKIGIDLKEVTQLHSKIVVADNDMLCVGSFNWLSADRTGKYARHETSLVYRGAHLIDEIGIITASLKQRQARSELR